MKISILGSRINKKENPLAVNILRRNSLPETNAVIFFIIPNQERPR